MGTRTQATSIAARARMIKRMDPGERRSRETNHLAHRIYAESHRLHLGDTEVIAIFDDGSILRMQPLSIKSLRLRERRKLIKDLGDEPGHTPRTPGHSLQYERLQKTSSNVLDPNPS